MKQTNKHVASNPYTTGKLNRLIDDLVHPLYGTSKGFILVDGFLHSLVERNPAQSVKKFAKYSIPVLMKPKKPPQRILGGRKRHYHCQLPRRSRRMYCGRMRAGPRCLRKDTYGVRCSRLTIMYKPVN